jgi:outer membrane receptor for ferrienterochelin and colicins
MANVDYQINFNDDNSSFIAYLAGQHTGRDHFTGILPDDSVDLVNYLADPPYGTSEVITLQGGLQINHRFTNFFGTDNVITFGGEYIDDRVNDVIEAYNYLIDQETKNLGLFLQSDWEISNQLSLLSGLRMDQHNLVDNIILSPRVSFMYRPRPNTQFRFTYSTGFRAPQAFDTDLHIAFAGGGVSRVFLDPDLVEERSQSLSTSINYDRAVEKFVAGFTLEGFHTFLRNAFYLESVGEDNFGEVFMKQNNPGGATVQGVTLELRANYNQYFQLEGGYTIQSSLYEDPVVNIDGLEARKEFLRTPDHYGYATLSFLPDRKFNTAINLVYTGPMLLTHFAGAPEQTEDAYKTSDPFTELGFRSSYTFELPGIDTGLELFGGIKNITNAYQNDFDSGKNRDSNFVYGPAAPRTYFIGLRIKSL